MKKLNKSMVIYCACIVLIVAVTLTSVWAYGSGLFTNDVEQTGVCIVETPESYANKDFSDKIVDGVLKLADCGAEPDSNYDYGDLIRSAFQTCIDHGAVLEFEEGATYYCSPSEDKPDFICDFSGLTAGTFTLRGNGATIMNCDNYSGFVRFNEGTNLNISGIVYDYVVVPWVQGEIVALDEESQTMTLLLDDDYTILDDSRFADNKDSVFGIFRDADNPKYVDVDSLNYFRHTNIKKLEDRGYEVSIWNHFKELGDTVVVGDKITINNRKDAGLSFVDARYCGSVTLSDITVYATNGCLFLGQYNTGDITLTNVKQIYKPDSNRWLTGNSDGVHIWGCTGKVTLDGCVFEGLSDDGMNLYQGGAVVTEQISDTEFIVSGEAYGTYVPQQVGEEIIFYTSDGEAQGEATVTKCETVDGKWYGWVRKITVDKAPQNVVTGTAREEATMVFRKNQMFNGTTIKNCTFRNIRARAIVLRTLNTTIENCTFERTSNHAIYIGDWNYEGPYCDGITIRNNTFNDCGYIQYEANNYKSSTIGVYTEKWADGGQGAFPAHKNILIEGNTIKNYHGHAVRIGNTVNAIVKNNTFSVEDHNKMYTENAAVRVDTSTTVEVSGNTFLDKRPCLDADIVYDGSTTGTLITNDNTYALESAKNVVKK